MKLPKLLRPLLLSMDKGKQVALTVAGQTAILAHRAAKDILRPGVNVLELEKIIRHTIETAGMSAAFLGYKGYPAASCISVNDEIVHGIPKDITINEGDVVSIDLGVTNDGWIVDTARTYLVGQGEKRLTELINCTQQALDEAIASATAGATVGDIGAAVERVVKNDKFFVVKDLTGHGVGRTLQEPPTIPNHGQTGSGPVLKAGMVLAIEPITTDKPTHLGLAADGWTIVSDNGAIAAHIEDTIIVTNDEPVILTR